MPINQVNNWNAGQSNKPLIKNLEPDLGKVSNVIC